MRSWLRAVPLLVVPFLAASAQKVTDAVVPLPDDLASSFSFFGDMAVVTWYDGSGKVTAHMTGYRLGEPAQAWHQEIRVQQNERHGGPWFSAGGAPGVVVLGNGPVTALDLRTGQTTWSLDCGVVGAVDMRGVDMGDGTKVVLGSEDCGELVKLKLLRINVATGQVLWQVRLRAREYTTDGAKYRDYKTLPLGDGRMVFIGEKLQAIDLKTGAVSYESRDDVGRLLNVLGGDALFLHDGNLSLYRLATGERAWRYDMRFGFGEVELVDGAHPETSDLILFTRPAVHRIARATGQATWVVKRDREIWGQAVGNGIAMAASANGQWDGLDVETGQKKWHVELQTLSNRTHELGISTAKSGVIVFREWDKDSPNVVAFIGVDPATGKQVWSSLRDRRTAFRRARVVDSTTIVGYSVLVKQPAILDARTGDVKPLGGDESEGVEGRETADESPVLQPGLYYDAERGSLRVVDDKGAIRWERPGKMARRAKVRALEKLGVVVFPRQEGGVEVLAIADGSVLATIPANVNPVMGVSADGWVLVPQGRQLHVARITR